jgi:hypothetical protein
MNHRSVSYIVSITDDDSARLKSQVDGKQNRKITGRGHSADLTERTSSREVFQWRQLLISQKSS